MNSIESDTDSAVIAIGPIHLRFRFIGFHPRFGTANVKLVSRSRTDKVRGDSWSTVVSRREFIEALKLASIEIGERIHESKVAKTGPLTISTVAESILKYTRGRGKGVIYHPKTRARRWLANIPWFEEKTQYAKAAYIGLVVTEMRSQMSKKAGQTRRENKEKRKRKEEREKAREEKREALQKDKDRQRELWPK